MTAAISPHRGRATARRLASAAGLVALVVLGTTPAWAAVTRGPYLQKATPSSIVVRWRTAAPSDSVVRYGTTPGAPTRETHLAALTTEHRVELTGLQPFTRYYYSVGSTSEVQAGGTSDDSFVTPPPVGSRAGTRVWVLGDSGTATASAAAVRDGYAGYTGRRGADLMLMLGDNAYPTGTDAQYQAAVFDMYRDALRQLPVWPTFGNHDAFSATAATQTGVYFNTFSLPRAAEAGGVASGTEAYYSFDYANIHFICLDSEGSLRTPGSPMLVWLTADLAATTQEWVVAYWHHAPYSKGSHDSDSELALVQMRQHVLPLLEAGGVDLVLSGHSHSYERSVLVSGHYGVSSTLTPSMVIDGGTGQESTTGAYRARTVEPAGTVYAVAGSSGTVTPAPLNHPVMATSLASLGSLVLDVDGLRLDARFVDAAGTVRDAFTLIKHEPSAAPRAPLALSTQATAGRGRLAWVNDSGGAMPADLLLEAFDARDQRWQRLAALALAPNVLDADGLARGSYVLRLRSRTADGTESAPSAPVHLTVGPGGASVPRAPLDLTASTTGSTVTLGWASATDGPAAQGFVLEAGSGPGAADLARLTVPAAGVAVSEVPAGVYFVRVRASNATGESAPTADVQVVVGAVATPPAAPSQLRAAVRGHDVRIAWQTPPGSAAPTTFELEAGSAEGLTDVARMSWPADAPQPVFTGVPSGTYYLRVRGRNAAGAGVATDDVRVVVP